MTKPLPHQLLWEARQIAAANHLHIVEVEDMVKLQPVTAYVVYRQAINGSPSQRLGKRRSPAALLHFVKTCAGVHA